LPDRDINLENLPAARIGSRSPGRVRFKIESERGNVDYFTKLEKALKKKYHSCTVSTTPLTGSLLIAGEDINTESIVQYCTEHSFFTIDRSCVKRVPLAQRIADPLFSANEKINRISDGMFDVPGIIFISGLFFGAYEILRGNLRKPPWYTAFWYAFGVYSKTYFDNKKAAANESESSLD